MRLRSAILRKVFSLCFVFWCAGSFCFTWAQATAGGFSVSGTVVDASGLAVSGAKVDLQKVGGAVEQSTTTSGSGGFRFDKVTPGAHEVSVHLEGFQPVAVRVRLGARPLAPLRITLALAALHQEVTVTSSPTQVSTDTSENLSSAAVSGQVLSNLPVFDQDYIGTMSRFLDTGEVGTSGATLIVDGVEVNDLGVSPSAIQEIKINQNPYDAQYPRPGWGRIEVTTKAGAEKYHGTFNFIFRDARLNARNAFALVRPPEQRRIYEGFLTGPVGHSKKTSFLVSADRDEEDVQSIVFALGPSGVIQENVPSPLRNLLLSGRVDHTVNDNHSFSLSYSYQDRTNRNQGVGGFSLPEAAYNTEFREDQIRFSQRLVLSPKLVNQFRLLLGQYRAPAWSVSGDPRIVVQGAFTGGGAQADQLRTERHFALTEMLSYASGKHVLKWGLHLPDWSRRGLDNNLNTGGTFSFSTLQDYLQGRPYSFTLQQGNGHLVFIEKVVGPFIQDDIRLRPNLMLSLGLRYDWQNYFYDHNRFAPRLAFAYAPTRDRKTVLRGGLGIFYDRTGPGPISDLLLFNGERLRKYVLTNPGYPNPLSSGGSFAAQPVSIVRLDPNFTSPYMLHYSFGVERQFDPKTTLTITYSGSRGIHQFRSRDLNAPLPPLYAARPDPAFGAIRTIEAAGRRVNDSLRAQLRGNVTRHFTGMVQYRLGRSMNDTDGISSFPANQYDLSGEWGRADWDRRQRFELLGTLRPGKLFNLGIGCSLYSGGPYTLTTGRDDYHDGMANARPPGVPRNSLEGPGHAALDLRWSRDFFLAKAKKEKGPTASMALEAFNVLNRVNFDGFVGDLSSPFFGHAVSADPPRRLQLSLRFKF